MQCRESKTTCCVAYRSASVAAGGSIANRIAAADQTQGVDGREQACKLGLGGEGQR